MILIRKVNMSVKNGLWLCLVFVNSCGLSENLSDTKGGVTIGDRRSPNTVVAIYPHPTKAAKACFDNALRDQVLQIQSQQITVNFSNNNSEDGTRQIFCISTSDSKATKLLLQTLSSSFCGVIQPRVSLELQCATSEISRRN